MRLITRLIAFGSSDVHKVHNGISRKNCLPDRAQSELLGFILLIGLTLAGMTAVVVMGSAALTESQSNSQIDRAEHAMTQLDSKLSLVALGGSSVQQSVISRESSGTRFYVDGSAGWINVSIYNSTDQTLDVKVMNVTMGAVVYEHDREQTSVAYQGGGVWRGDKSGSSMVSPPEFHYRTGQGQDPTLTLPLVVIPSNQSLGNTVSMTKTGDTIAKYPIFSDDNLSNPLREGEVNVTVHSKYYQAWGDFFESRTGGTVKHDHAAETVTVTLISTSNQQTINYGLSVTGEELALEGGGSDPTHLDSYNSSGGNYSSTVTSNGTFESAGLVDVTSNIELEGNVRTGDTAEVAGNAEINGTIYWTTEEPNIQGNPTITGGTEQISGVDASAPIGTKVRNEVDELSGTNDNDEVSDVSDNSLDAGDTLTGGDYYITNADINGGTVTFDTGSSDVITIGIDDDVSLNNGKIDVTGSGDVRIYVKGDEISVDNSEIAIPDNNSRQLWVYGTEEVDISILDSVVNGVFYAPTGTTGDGTVTVDKSELFGAVAGGGTEFKHSSVHQDLALKQEIPMPNDPNIPQITYLHVSINQVSITDS